MMAVATMDRERWTETEISRRSGTNVGRVERWVSMVAGGALAAYGLKRRSAPGGAAALAGAALLYRGATGHCAIKAAITGNRSGNGHTTVADRGSDTRAQLGGAAGIHVEEWITIERPVTEVYRFWRNLENLPRFMNHLESVAQREGGISHWVAKGPAGTKVEWDARIINDIPNKVIAWQSLEGSMVSTAGSVTFESAPRGTVVRVHFQYNPPAGKVGAAVAWLFGEEPNIQVREDLRRFKEVMEGRS
jgi:uncharacterized membrane protein